MSCNERKRAGSQTERRGQEASRLSLKQGEKKEKKKVRIGIRIRYLRVRVIG